MPPDPDRHLADPLLSAIEESGLSLTELAGKADVAPSQLSRFVAGKRDLALATAGRICSALGVELKSPARPKGRPKKAR